MISRLVVCGMLLFGPAVAQKREYVELQREIAGLQEQIRAMQTAVTERLAQIQVMAQQAQDASIRADKSVGVLEGAIVGRLRDQEKQLAGPVATIGLKVDQLANEFQAVRESVNDLVSRMGKLQAQMVDVNNAVKTLKEPPAAPPSATPPQGAGGSTPPANMSAASLYDNARRDMSSGNVDLALQQFMDYVKYFPTTDLAPNAQFYIGQIFYDKGQMDSALASFDLVLEKYSDNPKTDDAMYMKGMALLKIGERTAAAQEFRELLKRNPRGELESKARAQMKNLGLSAPAKSKKTR